MFKDVNIRENELLKGDDLFKKQVISSLYSIPTCGFECNGINNLLVSAGTILSILCHENGISRLNTLFENDHHRLVNIKVIKVLDGFATVEYEASNMNWIPYKEIFSNTEINSLGNYSDYVANVKCASSGIITNAMNWFKSTYSDMLQKVSANNISEDSKKKITQELNRVVDYLIRWISLGGDDVITNLGYLATSIVDVQNIPDAISFTIKELIAIYKEIARELLVLILGDQQQIATPQPTIPVVQQPVIPVVNETVVNNQPSQINIEVEPEMQIDVLQSNFTPSVGIPSGYSQNSAEVMNCMPFINFQTAYSVPQYNDEDINKHIVIGNNVNVPDKNIQKQFGALLKKICKILDEKDKLLGYTEPSKFTFTIFYTNMCWKLERIRKNGQPYKQSDKGYQSIVMNNSAPQWFGPSK